MSGTRLETMNFDGAAIAPDERFARYRALYANGADAVVLAPVVEAAVRAWRLDRVLVYERRIAGIGHERGPARVATDQFDHFTLTLLLGGRFEIDGGQGFVALAPRQAMLLDMRRPMRNRMWDAHAITISIARARLAEIAGDPATLHGATVGRADTALLADFLQALIGRIDTLPAASIKPVTVALTAMMGIAVNADVSDPRHAGERQLAARIDDVRVLVDAQLADPGFGADELVIASRLSRATLYRLLAPFGGVAIYIQGRRLERLRIALAMPLDPRSFANMCFDCGFKSESHASRLFQQRFKLRPGEYRHSVAFPANADDPRIAMRAWEQEVR